MMKTDSRSFSSDGEWKLWGKLDPLWGVCSWPEKSKQGRAPWTDEEFYRVGQLDWEDFQTQWERYGVDKNSCLEIGAGAGRMTKQLATCFRTVDAVDVSEDILHYARERVTSTNVRFHLTDGCHLPLKDESVTAAFSCQVLQHMPSTNHVKQYFSEIARVLTPGATAMIHVPVHCSPCLGSRLSRMLFRTALCYDSMKMAIARTCIKWGFTKRIMQMTSMPVEYFYGEFLTLGFSDVAVVFFEPRGNKELHSFVMARKRTR